MKDWQSLTHVKWDCKYHVVLVPKYRKRVIYGQLRKEIGVMLKDLFGHKGADVVEGHAMTDHIHLCVSIPPKHSIAHVLGYVR